MKIEIRSDPNTDKKELRVSGYVNVVGRDSRTLHDTTGPYIEQITPGAFGSALQTSASVELRFNHEQVLGSTKTGEVTLREDNIGLLADAVVSDPAVIQAAERRALRGWSFGFVKKADRWTTGDDGSRRRFVDALDLREVSILDITPAYIATSIETRDETETLVEFRMADAKPDITEIREEPEKKKQKDEDAAPASGFLAGKRAEIYRLKRRSNG